MIVLIIVGSTLGYIFGMMCSMKLIFHTSALDPDDVEDWFPVVMLSVFLWPFVIIGVGFVPLLKWWVKWRPFYKTKEEKEKKRRTKDWV